MPLPEVTALENTCVLETPSPLLNAAFRYAKDNMARCMRWYTLGWGMSDAPQRYATVVGRHTAWACLGADYVAPWFAPAALAVFRERQRPNGAIPERVDMESGRTDDPIGSVSDSTPLFIRAVVHRHRHFPNAFSRDAFLPAIRRAAEHLIAEIGPDDLIARSADPGLVTAAGSALWRHRNADDPSAIGEVSEINALAAQALRLAAEFTGDSGYRGVGDRVAVAVNRLLWDDSAGNYGVTRDRATGAMDTRVTGDTLFPVLCGIANVERTERVIARLGAADFQTPRGLRTVPESDAGYQPNGSGGTQGAVWPNLTLWYAASLAASDPDAALDTLERIARPVVLDEATREAGAIPTEFAEYFDGDTGQSLGRRLSPWVAPTFLWAVLEGLLGITWVRGEPRFAPNWPSGWDSVTLRSLQTGSGCTDITIRRGDNLPVGWADDLSAGIAAADLRRSRATRLEADLGV
jgi:glycogen debranching enzyme